MFFKELFMLPKISVLEGTTNTGSVLHFYIDTLYTVVVMLQQWAKK